jgi:hypothetical protein
VNVLLHVADLESDTVEPEIPGDGDVEDMVAGTGLVMREPLASKDKASIQNLDNVRQDPLVVKH